MPRSRLYRSGVLEREDFPAAEAARHLADPSVTLWLDLDAPTGQDLAALATELGLHPLAVASVLDEDHQRPKFVRYDHHSFLAAYTVLVTDGVLAASELDAFVTDRVLITVHRNNTTDIDAMVARWDTTPELAKSGTAFLLHGLLDYLVDGHLDAVQALDEQVEALEDLVFADHVDPTELQRRSLRLRRSLGRLRHLAVPMREIVAALMRRDDTLLPYFQDVYDHVLRATEWTESLRELIATIRETQLTIQGNRLNTIMKKVTSWAAIIAVPTAITGFYGQNIPYPGFGTASGVWVSMLAILIISATLYALFKRRDWL
ncbi:MULTISPECIES: magnesium transporter CorA family protein [unclassified Amycolatopsis]|uniref:magnesium transporter CorA family protein n=1 Tax=unclassified Amycolatopsis TaxID=2618356 RepID=UPI00287617E5|nr:MULTISPECIES: magnesium transporter CorA family protein [unclassified Amycolatopsis]MDS0134695.1 magnesium transporter CorA family protein [Amycolatopsis sp. 505]MDS0147406.1 magnesium transporter CorA family protein [Amycolatopsis sp. CM201R]